VSDSAGFPTFAPGRRTRKGLSWWAIAWIDAMEESALEPGRLARGRTYANTGRVGPISVSPGLILAVVHGNRPQPYRTRLRLQTLDEAQWDAFLEQVGSHAGRMAALLDGDMPHDLVDAAAAAGVPLLPGLGDLDPECSCPDWGHPCKHAAALAYQAGWLLNSEPFVLLLLRGRGEDRLRRELPERNARHAGIDDTVEVPTRPRGEPARAAYRASVAPLPSPVPPPTGPPAHLVLAPSGQVDEVLLERLVQVAAHRARQLLQDPDLEPAEQAVAVAAALVGTAALEPYLAALDDDSAAAVAAWHAGGRAGLAALEQPWTPPRTDLARARAALDLAWGDDRLPELATWRNRWTLPEDRGGRRQLRYGRDGRWYPFRQRAGRWWPAGDPDTDPAVVLATLLADPG
jgi:uncharacterized Zn finger protein